jgi:hypothetical protein
LLGFAWPSLWGLSPTREVPDDHHHSVHVTTIAITEPVFSRQERLALAGFLAGYTGLTREAYALDLRQYTSWCQQYQLRLFQARRADIGCFARDLEARGRPGPPSPAASAPSPGSTGTPSRKTCSTIHQPLMSAFRLVYESHATGLDRNELGALLVAAGLGQPAEHALISLLALNELRVSEAARRRPDRPTGRWPRRDQQARRAAHAPPRVHNGSFDAGVPLRDVQEAASHADPRTTIRYDRARGSLDRHATYIVAALYVAGASR